MKDAAPFKAKPAKPPQRVYVVARDPDTGETKSMTAYGVTPEKFIEAVRGLASGKRRKSIAA